MKQTNKIPNIILYAMNKKDSIGILRNITELSCDYYFNAASEMKFEMPSRVYEADKGEWIDNPHYNDVEVDKLLYFTDPTEQFKFQGSKILPDNQYYIKSLSDTEARTTDEKNSSGKYVDDYPTSRYNANNGISGFKVQEETMLFDLGIANGYTWDWQYYIDTHNHYTVRKPIMADTEKIDGYAGYKHLCCDNFIPVEDGDVIALRTGLKSNPIFAFRSFFYLDDDSSTGTGTLDNDAKFVQPNPLSRTRLSTAQIVRKRKRSTFVATEAGKLTISDTEGTPVEIVGVAENVYSSGIRRANGDTSPTVFTAAKESDIDVDSTYYAVYYIEVDTNASNFGYLKFDCVDLQGKKTINAKSGTTTWTWHLMPKDYVRVYSGKRNVTEFNVTEKVPYSVKQVWWVVTDVDESNDGINKVKTITAKSYEYTLSKKTFSLAEGIQPLYIPSKIKTLINSDNWKIDAWIANGTKHQTTAPQRCSLGLLNHILDYLPEWSIGYVDSDLDFFGKPISSLCCKYRNFDDIDNSNLYSFLISEVEKAYQCFFIFDSENMTINIINGNPTTTNSNGAPLTNNKFGSSSNVVLTWNNAIKNTNIQTTEDRIVTALRVHTAEDEYSMGLINPTGNNILYNFSAYKSQMQYVADADKNRTLWEAVEAWQTAYNQAISSYQSVGKTYVQNILTVIQNESSVSDALSEYRSVVDKINIAAESSGATIRYTDYPIYYASINMDVTENWRKNYIKDLYTTSKHFYESLTERDKNIETRDSNYATLKQKSITLTMDYQTALNSQGQSILSPLEVLELQKFIVEGDWTNENAVFSKNFSAQDIVDTLKSVYKEAQNDHNNYISQQCYEFDITSTNVMNLDGFAKNIDDLTLGRMVSLQLDNYDWQFPILLAYHIDYKNDNDFTMTFDTNYSNKPIQKRFAKLFNAINQTNTSTNTYTFEK